MMLATSLIAIDTTVLATAVPAVVQDLGGFESFPWLFSIYLLAQAVTVPVIASGGVGTLDHLVEGVTEGHASAVLAASIFHFGTYTIRQAKEHMAAAGIPMRLT